MHLSEVNFRNLFMARANPTIKDNEDRTPIHLAAERGHTATVEFLAEKFKANVYDRARDGSTLMHLAALHGHSDTAMVLFKKGVPLLMPNRYGARGIHTAAMHGHVSVISTLIQKGEDVDCTTNDNYTALHLAVEAGKATVVEALLGQGAKVHIRGGKSGETALHIASRIDEVRGEKCTRMLLKSGADPNMTMSNGRTALHVAAENGTMVNIKFLLQNGSDVMLMDGEGETALHKAAKTCHQPTVKEILLFISQALGDCSDFVQKQNKLGETALHHACRIVKGNLHFKNEDVILIRTLMEFKSNPTIQTFNTKESVLHYIAAAGNADILEELLKHMHAGQIQLAVNQQTATGWSPLCMSSAKGHINVTHLLLENNARVDVFDHEGKSSLHLAAEVGSTDCCQLLVRKNAFVNSRTKNGWTAIHFGALKGHIDLVKVMVKKYDATVDAVTMKKQTPLHLAALSGKLEMCRLLLDLDASMDSADEMGQKPIHMAATSDKPEVILLFLKARPSLVSSATKDGSTCAHIAAKRGSALVIKELMKFDKSVVLSSKNKITDSAPIHIASEGGHREVVKILLQAGAAVDEENKSGFTPVHIAAKFGHTELIEEFAENGVTMRDPSRKNGMTALHIAAFFGESETTRELLTHIPAQAKSNFPVLVNLSLAREIATECDLTPLHLASFTGAENVVRILLNYAGVNVECQSSPSGYIPLHLACISGHVGVVGLLLSRTTALLKSVDTSGRTCLHVAARSGHYEMVQVLIGQGADPDIEDKQGWLALHHAAFSGFLDVVQLLVDSGSSCTAETYEKKIPLWYAAKQGNFNVIQYLLRQDHNTESLLSDRKFVFNVMVVGKTNKYKSIEDFVFVSPAPCYTAATLSAMYRDMALREKDRAADLMDIGDVCEELAKDLIGIAANLENPGRILNSLDQHDRNFIDTLIDNEQKVAISQYVVQQYLQEIWEGHLDMKAWQFILSFMVFLFVPPVWFFFSLPLAKGYNKVPVVKFMSYLTSHLYFMAFLTLTSVVPPDPTPRESLLPLWYEMAVWIWYLGLLLDRVTNPGTKGGLSPVKYLLVLLGIIAAITHGTGFFMDPYYWSLIVYVRNLFFAATLLFATVLILDFLSFHHLFGPWAIIIGELLMDVGKFVVVLSLFIVGYSFFVAAMNTPFGFPDDFPDDTNRTLTEKIAANSDITHPILMFELLFFANFGLNNADALSVSSLIQPWTRFAFKVVFASYLLLTVVVLINLLIAMMSDTYQRIQQQSDIEWKFGLAKLTRNMQRTQVAPSPLNILTTWMVLMHSWCIRGRNEKKLARKKFRQAMKDEIMNKAPGMKFVLDVSDEKRKLTPRVIHALGNIKWGFTDGIKPVPVDVIQSRWDKEHAHSKGGANSMEEMEEFALTSRAVNWAQVIRRYLSLNGREGELKDAREEEVDVRSVMKSLVDIRNDGVQQGARAQAMKWTKIPAEAKKQVLEKWEEKARV
ncbi:ankyrin-1-like [Tigriopus californicus]|uniref:ankyrin-1-like n=1 Tax=Tigriopus californicus TaxID=6832 RepID=UPI0027DA5D02|nr:ankyrin-1-like [Tigriopus californicus]